MSHVVQVTLEAHVTCGTGDAYGTHIRSMWVNPSEEHTHHSEGSEDSAVSVSVQIVTDVCHLPQWPPHYCVHQKPESHLSNTEHVNVVDFTAWKKWRQERKNHTRTQDLHTLSQSFDHASYGSRSRSFVSHLSSCKVSRFCKSHQLANTHCQHTTC